MPRAADQRTADLLWRLRRQPSAELLREAGVALGHRFLGGALGEALAGELRRPGRHRLGIEVTDPTLADLPWEALVPPGRPTPLALDEGVDLYRTARTTPRATPRADAVGGPLRILAAIGSPDGSSRELLDYERELGRILDAVESCHRGGVGVRVLEWGSTSAIGMALAEEPVGILHVSCHARPGALLLETDTGDEDPVDAARFLAEVLPPGRPVPLIVLAGCSTARDEHGGRPGLARSLLEHGAPAVLAMNGAVSDDYATDLCARLYEGLARDRESDLLTVFSRVRRAMEDAPRPLPEWATPVLFLGDPGLRLTGPDDAGTDANANANADADATDRSGRPPATATVRDRVTRGPGDFIGRRRTLRRLSRVAPRMLLHGIGGIGKTSLAAELARRYETAGGLVVTVSGETGAEAVLEELRRRLVAHCAARNITGTHPLRQLVLVLTEQTRDWRERLVPVGDASLPVLLVLDNAEDNLDTDNLDTGFHSADEDLADFLAAWAERQALIITSRFPFDVPGLESHHLGPLSWQETRKLMWRLPGIDRLTPQEKRQVWTRLGGHPRSLEYLDALLRDGVGRFDDVTARLRAATAERTGGSVATVETGAPGRLGDVLAETGALIAEDVLLPQLLARLDTVPLAGELLLGASVYRLPVDTAGLAWQAAPVAEREQPPPAPEGMEHAMGRLLHLGLLAPADSGYLVHRWTAESLARRAGRSRLTAVHRRAGDYWGWRGRATSEPVEYIQQVIEARYHHLAGGRMDEALECTRLACRELEAAGQWSREERLRREALTMVPRGSLQAAEFTADLAGLKKRRGDYAQAEALYRKALATFRSLESDEHVAAALHNLGIIADHRGQAADAERLFKQSLSLKERIGDRWAMSFAYHELAGLALDRGDDRAAEKLYLDALAMAEEAGDLEGVSASHHQIALLALRAKDYAKAEQCVNLALDGYTRLNDRIRIGSGRILLSRIAAAVFNHETAQLHIRAALEVFEDIGSNRHIAECCLQLGEISRDLGDLAWAETCFARARTLFTALGERVFLAKANDMLGAVRTVLGRVAEAVPCTLEAWLGKTVRSGCTDWLAIQCMALGTQAFGDVLGQHMDPGQAVDVLELTQSYVRLTRSRVPDGPTPLGSAYILRAIDSFKDGDYGTARMCLVRALPICEAAGYRRGVAKCHEDLGLVGLETWHLDEAETRYLAALEIYERMRDDTNVAIVRHQLGRVHESRHDYAEAEKHLRASIAIKKRLGNPSGVSNSTFHLGTIAQRRGDYALAERCYLESLAIDEQQRDWKGIALDYAEIGNLRAEQGLSDLAVPLMVEALSINERITSDNAIRNIRALRKERAKLGDDAFTRILRDSLDEERTSRILELTALRPRTAQDPRPPE
ncbi:tetratricopeptide repeat protein [Streptomyces griseocarneus]|uniref:tetratricopeptide repeat protein n=1 Tax=Streptomyces griseocarneus TaxID=51201 RepID=UPI00167CCF27|nr:tetratricopeptide repeat protein [Streptomyces griseocarneus]MBZ6477903.1 tetratricopeptide repeat protein [Streptomyces griseocarneus]GHG54334.1 hypothetical protein GCM10018779_17210 [Streptomyces griseocarneus]